MKLQVRTKTMIPSVIIIDYEKDFFTVATNTQNRLYLDLIWKSISRYLM